MMKMIRAIAFMWNLKARRDVIQLRKMMKRIEKDRKKADAQLALVAGQLAKAQKIATTAIDHAQKAIDAAKATNKRMDEALTAANSSLQIANDITIPGLVQANATMAAAWDAQTAHFSLKSAVSAANGRQE